MIYLALTIAFSSVLFVVFKYFGIYGVNNLYAIIVNYFVAAILGGMLAISTFERDIPEGLFLILIPLSGLMGILFIVVFRLIAISSQQYGLRVASIATKMSLVIPAILGIALLGETLNPFIVIGVVLAIAAIVLSNLSKGNRPSWNELRLPFLVFLGSGAVDAGINLIRAYFLDDGLFPLFTSLVFFSAGIAGLGFALINRIAKQTPPVRRDFIGGIALGLPNYFSLFFLLKSLDSRTLSSTVVFTVNNVAIVLFSTLLGVFVFRERLNPWNYLGIGLAVLSILAVTGFPF